MGIRESQPTLYVIFNSFKKVQVQSLDHWSLSRSIKEPKNLLLSHDYHLPKLFHTSQALY